jgi:hypothetical protein
MKIGMTCKKHELCDLVHGKAKDGLRICSAKHHYEVFNLEHKYDYVFVTTRPEMFIEDFNNDTPHVGRQVLDYCLKNLITILKQKRKKI